MKINVTELLIDTGAAELREGPNFKVKIWHEYHADVYAYQSI